MTEMPAVPHQAFREALEIERIERNATRTCSGFEFELFRDRFVPDLEDVSSLDEADARLRAAAVECGDAWLARRAAGSDESRDHD